MTRKAEILKKIIGLFPVLVLVLFAAQSAFSQCGNYFKTNYRAVNKIGYNNTGGHFTLADWTGDGKPDFYAFRSNPSTQTWNIVIYPVKPTGYWDWDNPIIYTTTIPISHNGTGSPLAVKDFNSDGRIDLMYVDRILQNNGNGSLITLAPTTLNSNYWAHLGYYDLNNDGLSDWVNVISVAGQGHSIGFHLANADGSFNTRVSIYTGVNIQFSKETVGDFSGDGRIDIVTQFSGNRIFFKNLGGGNFEVGNTVSNNGGSFKDARDFNNDGKIDILGSSLTSQKMIVSFGRADGTFDVVEYPAFNLTDAAVKALEMNGDNNLDLIEYSENHYSIYLNNGAGGFSRTDYQKSLTHFTASLEFADFSGDNKADIYDNSNTSWNHFNEQIVFIKENVCQSFGETKRANFDGDSFGDLVMWNPNTGNFSSRSTGANFHDVDSAVKNFNWGLGSLGDIPALGDFDGDGKTDYSVYRNSTGNWYILLSSNSSWYVFKFGLTGDIPVPSDYDGGGKSDIAVFRPSDGNWYIWYSESQQFSVIHFGANGDRAVPEDYDGDGKTDVAVFRPSEGNWYYYKSFDQTVGIVQWGISTDKPLPADYDGDGKADLTVFRNGDWYILRSTNNSFNLIHLGAGGDVPMPFYGDGDIANLVVYRASNTYWYNHRWWQGTVFGGGQNAPIYFGLPNN